MTSAMPPALSGEDLACIRGDRLVFEGLSFTVASGEALLLTGPNGSGKTSLLRLLAGLAMPAAGTIRRNGADVAAEMPEHRSSVHYIGHHDSAKPVLTVRENLAFWTALRGGGEVDDALGTLGLAGLAEVPARFLSAGQKRRLALARLLTTPAPVWLLDEPGVALDRQSLGVLVDMIRRHRAAGGLLVASTHTDLGLAATGELDLARFAAGIAA